MKLNPRAFGLAAGTLAALLFTLCALAVAVAPSWTTSAASAAIHLDLSGMARGISWAMYFNGLLFWSIGVGLLFAAAGGLYNRYLGRAASRARAELPEPRIA